MQNPNYRCNLCEKQFKNSSKLSRHLSIHSDLRPFACNILNCKKAYKRKEHLLVHQKIHLENDSERKPYPCSICGKAFPDSYHLKRHSKIHLEDKPYKCSYCSSSFTKHGALARHLCEHTGGDPYPCNFQHCNKSFKTNQKLQNHTLTHSDINKYKCGNVNCNFSTSKWTMLLQHLKVTHPPTCGTCSKTFTRPEGLKTHLLSSGHGPGIDIDLKGGSVKDPNDMDVDSVNIALFSKRIFKCEVIGCPKSFLSLNSLKVHFRSIHEGIKPYSCVTCLKSFAHKHLLARHTRVHIQKIADSETMESLEEKAEEEKESEVSNSEKLRKETELKCLLQLTGCDYNLYTKETGRILICPVNANSNLTKNLSCKMQFKRIYDLSRHIDAFHPEVKKNIFNATDISFDNDDRMLSDNIYVGEKLVVMS